MAEPQRIVAKVEELMRWCNELEAQLAAADTLARNCSPPPSTGCSRADGGHRH